MSRKEYEAGHTGAYGMLQARTGLWGKGPFLGVKGVL